MKYQKGTFLTIPNKEILRGLKPLTQATFMWICNYADENGECFPSRSKIAEDCGVATRTIDPALKELEEVGLISKIIRKKGKENLTNIYQVNLLEYVPPSIKNDTTPSADLILPSIENDTVTQSINSIQNNSSRLSDESEKTEINEYLKFPLPPDWSDDSFVDSDGTFIPRFTDNFGRPIKQSEITSMRNQFKAKKAPVRRDTLSEDQVVELWNKFTTLGQNGVPRECQNPSCSYGILPESRLTPDIKDQIRKHAYKYKEISLWELAFKNYAKEIMGRWEDEKGYFRHRMSLYEFLLQKNGFIKYVNR